jgi:hypothetical protein
MAEARQIKVLRYETVLSYVVRLQTSINHVDEVRPHRLPLNEMRELLDAEVAESKEQPMMNLATHLQMAPPAATWADLKDLVSRLDTTAAGRLRLFLPTVSKISALEDNTNGNGKRERDDNCKWCNGSHLSDNCWGRYPDKKPEYAKNRELKSRPKFSFDAAKDELSMIMMWAEDAELEEVTLLMDDGRPFILVDSGASNLLFLLTDRNILEDFQVCDRELGTARVSGILQVRGTGKIGHQSANWCPDLRHLIISCGRLHSWTCHLFMLANTAPEIRTSHGQRLYGQYVQGMPAFALEEILRLARQQPFDNLSIVTTRAAARRPDDHERPVGKHYHERDDSSDAHGAPATATTFS